MSFDYENEPDSVDEQEAYNNKVVLPDLATVVKVSQVYNANGTLKRILKATKSDFVANLIYLNGKKFSFEGRHYLKPIYDRDDKHVLLKTARQVEKTTFLANNLVVTSAVKPWAKSLYVSPSHTQTRQFSNEKLRPALEKSPLIAKYFQDTQVSSQVFEKGLTNGAYIFLRSAFRSADRTRGISVDEILALDEIQDFLGSEVPVIEECTSHYPNSRILKAGTPKSNDNVIEVSWKDSTQNEWMVPCSCKKWNFLDENCIGPTHLYQDDTLPPGPICRKCRKPLNVKAGGWQSFNKGSMVQSYRISQLMVDWMITFKSQWMRLLHKRDTYPTGQLYNEVLGLSYDNASKPITRDELMEACRNYSLWDPDRFDNATLNESKRYKLYGGIDWGEGLDGSEKSPTGKTRNASYTVLTIGAYVNSSVFRPLLIKRYEGKEVDPDYVTKDITRIVRALGVQLTGADHGHGWGVNNTLIRYLGPSRLVMMQHLAKLKQKLKYDPIGQKYMLQRNFVMSEIFFDIKNGFIEFPKWSQFERFGKDILAIFAEYCDYRREIKYDHKASDPDDFFHSLLFCKLAADIHLGKSRRYTANIDSTPDDQHGD